MRHLLFQAPYLFTTCLLPVSFILLCIHWVSLLVYYLVSWFRWHIKLRGLFNGKTILIEEQQWYYSSIAISSSSCCVASTDLPDPLSLSVSIVHRSREVFQAISCIGTEMLYIASSWSSCLWLSMWWGPLEYIAFEFVLSSPEVFRISGSSNFDSFCDGW